MIASVTSRGEVLRYLENFLDYNFDSFLKTVEDSWQPADLLPDSRFDNFLDEVKDLAGAG